MLHLYDDKVDFLYLLNAKIYNTSQQRATGGGRTSGRFRGLTVSTIHGVDTLPTELPGRPELFDLNQYGIGYIKHLWAVIGCDRITPTLHLPLAQ